MYTDVPSDWLDEASQQYGPRPQADLEIDFGGSTYSEGHRIIETGSVDRQLEKWGSYGVALVGDISIRLENTDGKFNPKNAASPYYPEGLIGKTARLYSFFFDGDTSLTFGPHVSFDTDIFFDSYATERVLHYTGAISSVQVNGDRSVTLTIRDALQTILDGYIDSDYSYTGNPAQVVRNLLETYTSLSFDEAEYERAFNNFDWIEIKVEAVEGDRIVDVIQEVTKAANLNIFTNELNEIAIYALFPDVSDFIEAGDGDPDLNDYSGDPTLPEANVLTIEGGHDKESVVNYITYKYLDFTTGEETVIIQYDADSIAEYGAKTLEISSNVFMHADQASIIPQMILERFKTPRRIYTLSTTLYKSIVNEIGDRIRLTDPAVGEDDHLFVVTRHGIDIINGTVSVELQDIEDFDGVKWGFISSEALESDGERISAIMDAIQNKDFSGVVNPGVDDSIDKYSIVQNSGTFAFERTEDESPTGRRFSGRLTLSSADGYAEQPLTLRGGPYLPLYNGRALDFDGSDDFVRILDAVDPTEYLIEMKVKVDTISNGLLIKRTDAGEAGSFSHLLEISSGKFRHYLWDGAAKIVTGTTSIVAGKWYSVAIYAKNGDYARLFVDGVEEGTAVAIGTMWTGGDRWNVGGKSAGGHVYFDGKIDHLVLFSDASNYALKVAGLYNAGDFPFVNPLGYWPTIPGSTFSGLRFAFPFDERANVSNIVYDISANLLTGTLNGTMTDDDFVDGCVGWESLEPYEDHILKFKVKGTISGANVLVSVYDANSVSLGSATLSGAYSDWTDFEVPVMTTGLAPYALKIETSGGTPTGTLYFGDMQIDSVILEGGTFEINNGFGVTPHGWSVQVDSGALSFTRSGADYHDGSASGSLSIGGEGKIWCTSKFFIVGDHQLHFWYKGTTDTDLVAKVLQNDGSPLATPASVTIPAGTYVAWTEAVIDFESVENDVQNLRVQVETTASTTANMYVDDFRIDNDEWPFQVNWKQFMFFGEDEAEALPGYDKDGNRDGAIDGLDYLAGFEQLHVVTN